MQNKGRQVFQFNDEPEGDRVLRGRDSQSPNVGEWVKNSNECFDPFSRYDSIPIQQTISTIAR